MRYTNAMGKVLMGCLLLGCVKAARADYISYYLVHVGVDHTLKENRRQRDIRDGQATVGAMENANRSGMDRLKTAYGKVIGRLSSLGLLIDAAFLVREAYPMLDRIVDTQGRIVQLVRDEPYLLAVAIPQERHVVEKARSLVLYLTGLMLSLGDLNQLKGGDRKLLLDHALTELRSLSTLSQRALSAMRSRLLADRLARMRLHRWVNRERELIGDIIRNANRL